MNIMFKLCMIAVMAIGFTFTPEASASSLREHQLCHEVNMPPAKFIQNVKASLAADPSGNRLVTGCNATPLQFMQAINGVPELQAQGFALSNVSQLPDFVKQLEERPFVAACLSGMRGDELVLTCREPRPAKRGEVGYWYGNIMVFAGDCMNTVSYAAATTLGPVEVTGTRWQAPPTRPWSDPFAGQTAGEQCPFEGARLTGVHVFAQEALNTPCAQQYVIDRSRYTSGRGTVGSWVKSGNEDVFSLKCGRAMHDAANAGKIGWSRNAHRVELNLVHNGQSQLVFAGTVTGNILAAADENSAMLLTPDKKFVDVPPQLTTGVLVWSFPDGGMASPTESGAGMDISRLQRSEGCRPKVKVASAIEGSMGSGYAYDE